MLADELVEEIHFYFSEFDRIISRYPIEKIKTIGDSYMCAGGLPLCNDTHAVDVVNAALEFQEFMEVQKVLRPSIGKHGFELRIGIHTGPVVSGIVGTRKFAYDIWGDTVNTASRMETSGEPGKVNISGATFEKVKDHFICLYRGKIQAKNKGSIDMYFAGRRS
jgi:adenylate cyclase